MDVTSIDLSPNLYTGDFKEPTALLLKSKGISPVLAACPITWIPPDEEPLCGNVAVYPAAVVVVIVVVVVIIIIITKLGPQTIAISREFRFMCIDLLVQDLVHS